MVLRAIFASMLLIFLRGAGAMDITGKELEAHLRGEYSRGFGYCGDFSVIGAVKPIESVTLRGGLSAGSLSDVSNIKAFSSVRAAPFSKLPLTFSLIYDYDGLLDYDVHTHSILPVVSYNTARVGISYGPNFRFTSFFGESVQFEPINSISVYFNAINNEKRRLEAVIGNFGDFYAKNMGAYSLKLNYAAFITVNWTLIGGIELLQSGSDVLSANFYGTAFRGGAKYSW